MSFEYKIIATFTDKQTKDICELLEQDNHFDKRHFFENKEFWDFRHFDNQRQMPNLSIAFEHDGIYICQNISSYLWQDLDRLKNYIEAADIDHKIVDYSN